MKSYRAELTPQMLHYADKSADGGEISWFHWQPYLQYFHPTAHVSDVVNTDHLGFRVSHGNGQLASVGGPPSGGPVRLIVGSSTVFGMGATRDETTLASRLWTEHAPGRPWLNFGGRSYNPTQELLLFVLYRHLLPEIDEIVLFTGFNALALAWLPQWMQGDHGAFFFSVKYFDLLEELNGKDAAKPRWAGRRPASRSAEELYVPDLPGQIAAGTDLTLRHLDTWRALASAAGARLTFVLQPLAQWVRAEPAPQERLLFAELDHLANFDRAYGEIARMDVGRRYAEELRAGCDKLGVQFLDMNPVLGEAIRENDWVFVDRIHFTDEGHDIVSSLLATELSLS
jgi:hypothetical protein